MALIMFLHQMISTLLARFQDTYLLSLEMQTASVSFTVILIISLVMGIVLNYTMFWCTIVNSALTTTIVGVLKGVGSTVSLLSVLTWHHEVTETLLAFVSIKLLLSPFAFN
jgi:hypothetical protein